MSPPLATYRRCKWMSQRVLSRLFPSLPKGLTEQQLWTIVANAYPFEARDEMHVRSWGQRARTWIIAYLDGEDRPPSRRKRLRLNRPERVARLG